MEQITSSQLPELHAVNPNAAAEHWNDRLLVLSDQPAAFKVGVDAPANQEAAEHHMVDVWEQEQALLEIAVAKIEGRDCTVTTEDCKQLGLTDQVTKKSSTLVQELYRRMGAANDMGRSDILLTGLAGLVVEEIATATIPGFGELYQPTDDPIERSFAMISLFASRLSEQPELVKGRESEMLLTAELLSEALRAPESVRSKLGTVAGIDSESLDNDFYQQSIVQICDAVIGQLTQQLAVTPENASDKPPKSYINKLCYMQGAVLTKYDTLFDMVQADAVLDSPGEGAKVIFKEFLREAASTMDKVELGYAYELFAPLIFRYVALTEGGIGSARVWHATARADTPKDRLGVRPQRGEPEQISSSMKKQSSDMQIGRVDARSNGDKRGYGAVTERLQLKARTDAERFTDEYDQEFVGIHSEDAVAILSQIDEQLLAVDPEFSQASYQDRCMCLAIAAQKILLGIVGELSRRIEAQETPPETDFAVRGISTDVTVNIPALLDDVVLPVYRKMMAKNGISLSVPADDKVLMSVA